MNPSLLPYLYYPAHSVFIFTPVYSLDLYKTAVNESFDHIDVFAVKLYGQPAACRNFPGRWNDRYIAVIVL